MFLFLYLNILLLLSYVDAIQIETSQGNITGITRKILNREIHAFLGIPYAKSPTGELRFQNPVPFGTWKGVKNATRDVSRCLQFNFLHRPGLPQIFGSEDCLYLNVFTPSVVEPKKYPVMAFIHGGAFSMGTGSSEVYGPDFILNKDVVLVVMNYRLGAFGFASTEDAEMSGNFGLKDQTMALKWIQDNIAAYGGNPNSVTIFGQSAGSSSVHYHTISPLSKGLFHRAIAMSGSAHCPWCKKWPGEIAKRTKVMASLAGCPTSSSRLLVECLRKVSPERIFEINTSKNITDLYGNAGFIIFLPVVERKGIDGAFITDDPFTLTSSVPMMIGMTKNEGSLLMGLLQMNWTLDSVLSLMDENFQKVASVSMGYDNEGQDTTLMMKEVRKFYFGQKKINLTVIQDLINMYTDSWFLQCTTSAVRGHKGPGYLYLFTYKGDRSFTNTMVNNHVIDYGVTHGDDLLYLFTFSQGMNITLRDQQMINDMVSLWTNFAIYGNPTPANGSKVVWNQVSASDMNYLNINTANMTMMKHLLPERDHFWLQFQPKQPSAANRINAILCASILICIFQFFIH